MRFTLGEMIRQVRAIEAKKKAAEEAFEEKIKPLKDYATELRTEILQHLNAEGAKSMNTQFGTAYWKPKITYRVQDKEEFMRHVIGMEEWELVTWGTAAVAAEAFTNEHGEPPPGTLRNAVNILYVTAPTKPALRVSKAEGAPLGEPDIAAE